MSTKDLNNSNNSNFPPSSKQHSAQSCALTLTEDSLKASDTYAAKITYNNTSPASTVQSPKNRICPSCSCSSCANRRRHPPGDRKGNRPSITRTRASAASRLTESKIYFLPAGAAGAVPDPRMTLKNSEDGSRTMTSLFFAKVAL